MKKHKKITCKHCGFKWIDINEITESDTGYFEARRTCPKCEKGPGVEPTTEDITVNVVA